MSFLLSVCSVAVCLLLVLTSPPAPLVAAHWQREALALLALLPCLSVANLLLRRRAFVFLVTAARVAVVVVLGVPFGDWMWLRIPLWISVMVESAGFLDAPVSFLVEGAFLAIILILPGPDTAWGVSLEGPSLGERAAAVALCSALAALVHLLRFAQRRNFRERDQRVRLDEAVSRLTSANLSYQQIATSAEQRSAEDERNRITREIHDAIGYALTNLIMMMEAAVRLAPPGESALRRLLGQAREEAQAGLNETRRALRMLRGTPADRPHGLRAVQQLVTLFSQATGVRVKVDYCNAAQTFGDEVDLAVYRMIQEGMTNAFRHGGATLITLHFWQEDRALRVRLWDNGRAAEAAPEGIGLRGMRERICGVGGTLGAARVPDGFELVAWIPLAAPKGRTDLDGAHIASPC